ncbi:MAG: Adaptive-response sensory-kinase SasA [Chlamydiae bacterium]|nr:Adaptive-response sensory-kinase SasA [Chlamydiota bacterium]
MLNFRQKIFFSYLAVFLFFFILLFPYSSKSVRNAIRDVLENRTKQVIESIQKAPNVQGMIQMLSAHQSLVFFRVTLLSKDGRILYESHTDRSALPLYKRHPEIEEAMKHKIGYHEDYSYHFGEQFAYIAQSFSFQGQSYIIRTAFPINQIKDLSSSFKLVLIKFGIGILVLFSLMTWTIMNLITRPIQTIIRKITPYQEGREDELPEIILEEKRITKDFCQLANTLNSLSNRIRKQVQTLTQERNETETVLNSLAEGVIAVDNQFHITYLNDIALKMFHLTRENLLNKHISFLKSNKCEALLHACTKKNKIIYETLDLESGDQKIPLGIIVTPKQDQGAILVLQDKSNLYQILDLGKAFIANASHELKTPLTVIRGFSETLHDHTGLSDDQRKDIIKKILANCIRMDSLVRNLLMLADIENLPQSELKECDLIATLNDCAQTVHTLHKDADIQFEDQTHNKATILGDPDLLNRALMNLLENAIKYNQRKPILKIGVSKSKKTIVVTISDNGIGIPAKDLPHIFDRFYRVDKARTRKLGGSGLGLSIVQIIIEKLKGTLSVDSKEGEGSTFTLIFPEQSNSSS